MDYDFSKTKDIINKKQILLLIKIVIFSTSSYFLIKAINNNINTIKDLAKNYLNMIAWFIFVSSFLYCGLLVLLAKAWKNILESLDNTLYNNKLLYIYLQSLIYKYLPGNIFHYANRQYFANKMGIKHKPLFLSSLYEALGLIIIATIFSIFILQKIYQINYILILLVTSSLILLFCAFRASKPILIVKNSILFYLIYFIGIGLFCYYLTYEITKNNLSILTCISLYSTSWIAGYITPGSPGGLGIREITFIHLSNNLISQPEAILIITVLRATTILGELFVFFFVKTSSLKYYTGS